MPLYPFNGFHYSPWHVPHAAGLCCHAQFVGYKSMLDGKKAWSCLRFESKEHNSTALSAAASGPVECGGFLHVVIAHLEVPGWNKFKEP